MRKKFRLLTLILALSMLVLAGCAQKGETPAASTPAASTDAQQPAPAAQTSGKDVKMLVGSNAGGTTDLASRVVAKYLTELTGTNYIVTNIPGSNGNLAYDEGAKADPDGLTLTVQSANWPMCLAQGSVNVSYEQFEQVSIMWESYMAMSVRADSDYETFEDVVAAVEAAEPGTFKYGIFQGSPMESCYLALVDNYGWDLHIVDLDGGAKATELLGGRIEAYCDSVASLRPYVESGDFKLVGVWAEERLEEFPDVPTFPEMMGTSYNITQQKYGLNAPKGTSAEKVAELNSLLQQVYDNKDFQQEMKDLGFSAVHTTPEEYTTFFSEVVQRFTEFYAK